MTDINHAAAVAAGKQSYSLTRQVNVFLFDLKNEASEHGFRSTDSWMLQLANEQEMVNLKREHYPIISIRPKGLALLSFFQQVKAGLHQPLNAIEMALSENDLTKDEKQYLAAYRIKDLRK